MPCQVAPVMTPAVVILMPPLEVSEKVPVELPMETLPMPVVAIVTLLAPELARSVAPVEVRVVNLPVPAVVAPILVLLMPVAVVLKLDEVKVKALTPVLMEEAPIPDRTIDPEVPVRFKAPVVKVKPLEAVNVCDTVNPPLLVVVTPAFPIETPVALVVPKFKAVAASTVKAPAAVDQVEAPPAVIVRAPPEVNWEAPVGVKLTEPAPLALKLPLLKVYKILVLLAVVMLAPLLYACCKDSVPERSQSFQAPFSKHLNLLRLEL